MSDALLMHINSIHFTLHLSIWQVLFYYPNHEVSVCAKGRNQKIFSKMAAKQDLYGLLFEGCSTLSKNRKRNDLAGYHLKSFESQWTKLPSHRLSPERRFNPMVKKRLLPSSTHERKILDRVDFDPSEFRNKRKHYLTLQTTSGPDVV